LPNQRLDNAERFRSRPFAKSCPSAQRRIEFPKTAGRIPLKATTLNDMLETINNDAEANETITTTNKTEAFNLVTIRRKRATSSSKISPATPSGQAAPLELRKHPPSKAPTPSP
jgi:hypothetical protein